MSAQPPQQNFAPQQAQPGSAKSGSQNQLRKNGDGGFWTAIAGFILLLIFLLWWIGIGQNFAIVSKHTKILVLSAAIVLDLISFYRKLRRHDISYRQYLTNVFIWMTLIFAIPGLCYYLFLSQ